MDPPITTTTTTTTTSAPPLLRRIINLDTTVSLHLHSLSQPFIPRPLLRTLEISGDGRLFFPLILSVLLSPPLSLLRPFFISLLLGNLLDLLVIGLIKFTVRRPRPVYNKGMHLTVAVDHWSFPSGHSSRVCLIASYLYLCSAEIGEVLVKLWSDRIGGVADVDDRSRLFVWTVCVWASVTSISRVLLGRHFVFDVVVGACLGVLEGLQLTGEWVVVVKRRDKDQDHHQIQVFITATKRKPGQRGFRGEKD